MKQIPCVLMRGGTSKGVFLLADDLPTDIQQRDALILAIMGSGHPLQIDGIGGGSPQTSKVAIISPSTHPNADVDYLFAQVAITEKIVDTAPNCGNILCAVGSFSLEKGLVPITGDVTTVRVRNVNTNTFINATIQTRIRWQCDDCRCSRSCCTCWVNISKRERDQNREIISDR